MKYNFEVIRKWYKLPYIKFKMISYTYNREFVMLVPHFVKSYGVTKRSRRFLRCHNVQSLDWHIKSNDMIEKQTPYNFFYSLAKYKNGMPFFKHNPEADSIIKENWNDNHYKEMIEFDFLIDVDSKTHRDIYHSVDSAKIIYKSLEKQHIPFDLRFSGMGFHFIIPYDYFKVSGMSFNPKDKLNIYNHYYKIAKEMYERNSEMIDTKIYDSRRIVKIPYSLALYEDCMYMCSPIESKEELHSFELENYSYENKLKEVLNVRTKTKKNKANRIR